MARAKRDHDAETVTERAGPQRFTEALDEIIDYHAHEYYISTAEVVGILEVAKQLLIHRAVLEDVEDASDDGEAWKCAGD